MRAMDTDAAVGQWEMGVAAGGGGQGWVLTSRMTFPQGSEFWTVHVAPDLTPTLTEFERRDEADKVVATLKAAYGDGKVVVTARTSGQDQPPVEVKLPAPPYFDNEQFAATLRALPLAEGWKATLNDINTRKASKAQIQFAVSGKETVTVPAGTFECWVVELVGMNQKAWIAVAPPNQLTQYESAAAKLRMALVEYTPGQ